MENENNQKIIEGIQELDKELKNRSNSLPVDTVVISRLLKEWNTEMNKMWDEYQWCLDHKFKLEAEVKFQLKEQLRRKIHELEKAVKGL